MFPHKFPPTPGDTLDVISGGPAWLTQHSASKLNRVFAEGKSTQRAPNGVVVASHQRFEQSISFVVATSTKCNSQVIESWPLPRGKNWGAGGGDQRTCEAKARINTSLCGNP
jgi:hypothetical protein